LLSGVLQYHGINNACAVQKQVDKKTSGLTQAILINLAGSFFLSAILFWKHKVEQEVTMKNTFTPPPSNLIHRGELELSM
jgi:hypothetical protein